MDLMKLLSNPARLKVMQYLQIYGEATTKKICDAITEVPAPTLYRHIHALLKEEVLLIKEERKVRGSVERLLAINAEKIEDTINRSISGTAYQFLMDLYMKFHQYGCKENADPKRDRLSLRSCILTLNDAHFDSFMQDLAAVIDKYQVADKDGKLRSISFISAPIEEEGKYDDGK